MENGDQYMVVDCGGGTIDVTVHEMVATRNGNSVKEAAPANGGDWGSNAIDRRVFKFLEDVFGKTRFESMKRDVSAYTRLQEEIEIQKCSFDGETDVVLVLPDSLTAVINVDEDLTADAAMEEYGESIQTEFVLRGPNLSIPAKYFYESLMNPTIKTTFQHVSSVLDKYTKISRVIVVGNFANCKMLQQELQHLTSRGIKVVLPDAPGEAVMKGAVLFGVNPGAVIERASRFTYGVNLSKPFDPSRHPENKKIITSDGREFCSGIFDTFVKVGETFEIGHVVERTYQALERDQKEITFHIYSTQRPDTMFIDDFKVKEIGKVTISVSSPREAVSFIMMFSTQINVKAINNAGEENEVTLEFSQ